MTTLESRTISIDEILSWTHCREFTVLDDAELELSPTRPAPHTQPLIKVAHGGDNNEVTAIGRLVVRHCQLRSSPEKGISNDVFVGVLLAESASDLDCLKAAVNELARIGYSTHQDHWQLERVS